MENCTTNKKMQTQAQIKITGNRIGERLLKKNLITREILDQAIEKQNFQSSDNRRKLGDILINDFKVSRHIVYREIADMYAFSEVDLSNGALQEKGSALVKSFFASLNDGLRKTAREYGIFPYSISASDDNTILIAASDPTCQTIQVIASALGYAQYEVQYCRNEIIQDLMNRILPSTNEYLEEFENLDDDQDNSEYEKEDINETEIDTEIHKSRLTNLIEGCFVEAVRAGASDIHFVPKTGRQVDFCFRIDGKLVLWHKQSGTKAESVAAVIKDRSKNVNRFDRDIAQDGYFQRKIDGVLIRFRVSILPVIGVEYERKLESIVVRILDDRKVITDLKKLGLLQKAHEDFVKAINQPQGLVILTGPTGSGKSTTLIAALGTVMTPELNVLTVEDPVEYLISGSRQLKINPKMDFEQAIRSILRHDPDIVMVGEMRDRITAEIAFKLANTGHLTFSTLHTNDAASVVSRLYKMGIEPFLIAYAVNIVVAQRLIRRLCKKCKEVEKNIDPAVPIAIGFSEEEITKIKFYKATGCEDCHAGYSGRLAIHEALMFTPDIRKAIFEMSENINEEKIREMAHDNGMLSLRGSGMERIRSGETTCSEIAFVTEGKN